MNLNILPGKSFPIGATACQDPEGVNFSIYSKNATAIELLLFDEPLATKPEQVILLDPKQHRTHHYWHIFISGIGAGQIYAYRVYGPFNPEKGHRFDGTKVLLDPYARVVVGQEKYSREAATGNGDNCPYALKGVVADPTTYDWEDDKPLETPYATTVIYEMHVGGFTRNPNSGVPPEKRGTFAGLIEKIPYLKELGITAVELLPVQQFDEQDVREPLINYWGYSPIAFFAPHHNYSSRQDIFGPMDEFRDMVKALHKAGIEVILDVVFNHTAEGNENGPTVSFRGLENSTYYILEADDSSCYTNYSGCGNTFNTNNPFVHRLIVDCLCYWVREMHVDGFRFDLASVMSRSVTGDPLEDPPVLWAIESDPVLAGIKIIAEAWDAAGLYQVGSFIGDRFAEWNGHYRDDVRQFVKSDPKIVDKLAARIMGSPDIYPQPDREPNHSINFITCHDGFTMNDLVSYNEKHNEANCEDNRDGANDNCSWNCGVEGVTDKREIEVLRLRQIKNFFTVLFFSQGTPMILMGDEVRRTQLGNNNGYCQNNQLSWFDWSQIEKQTDLLRFVRGIINFTQDLEIMRLDKVLATFGQGTPELYLEEMKPELSLAVKEAEIDPNEVPNISWHGVHFAKPDWWEGSRTLAFSLRLPGLPSAISDEEKAGEYFHIMLNAYWKPLMFELPLLARGESWYLIVNTAFSSPRDFNDLDTATKVIGVRYRVEARSAVVLMAKKVG
ncbi:glycogen debranching protein GlgX [Dapis sp. BLCC M126]|uniref:glycogen debranching protein GlgX n=1 Tax=Dapis sp. BLCC M126 TaxID=3400189 RepID=UPI003CF050A3